MGQNVLDTSCHLLDYLPAWLLTYKDRVNSWQRIDSSHPPKKASNTFFFYAKRVAYVARKLWAADAWVTRPKSDAWRMLFLKQLPEIDVQRILNQKLAELE